MKKNPKINFYNLFWIFLIGSVFGFIIELIWFVIKWGFFQYNQGTIYGPFQPIYGFGAVMIAVLCSTLKTKKKWLLFLIGFVAFGLFEYISGWFMEYCLGAFAWDYTRVGFNYTIGKWVYLPYCFIWGFFAVIWDMWINKPLLNFLNRFKSKKIKYLTIVLAVFMIFNLALTSLATIRKIERSKDIPPHNELKRFIDTHYDDEYMKKWLPKIRVPKKI